MLRASLTWGHVAELLFSGHIKSRVCLEDTLLSSHGPISLVTGGTYLDGRQTIPIWSVFENMLTCCLSILQLGQLE